MEINHSGILACTSFSCEHLLGDVQMLIDGSTESSPPIFPLQEHQKSVHFQNESPKKAFGLAVNFAASNSSGFSSGSYSNNFSEERDSGIRFNRSNGSLISFHENGSHLDPRNLHSRPIVNDEDREFSLCGDDLNPNSNYLNIPRVVPTNLLPESSDSRHAALQSWLSNQKEKLVTDGFEDCIGREDSDKKKRAYTGVQEINGVASKKPKLSTTTLRSKGKGKDPQTIAAKNRRERISERLKTLQELVPNGSKVDLVSMLEKAISYVKFLQLQVKVLATDEFWPAQGTGKAPELSQVKEAIDAILGGHHQMNKISTSKSDA